MSTPPQPISGMKAVFPPSLTSAEVRKCEVTEQGWGWGDDRPAWDFSTAGLTETTNALAQSCYTTPLPFHQPQSAGFSPDSAARSVA
jgi:hypothetical protein